jgi:hypothetical protein
MSAKCHGPGAGIISSALDAGAESYLVCDCRTDWVVCFRRDCERAVALNEVYQRQIAMTLEILGDPRVSVLIHPLIF